MSMCMTDVGPNAAWRSTYYQQNPWSLQPNYSTLIGFELPMVQPDLLHIFNLGVCKDVIGCALKLLVKDLILFPGHDIETRFANATTSLRTYARTHGHCLRLKKLSKTKIQWESKKYPEFKGSGSDAHICAVWLEEVITPHANQYGDLYTLLWSSNRAMRLVYQAGRFLSEEECRTVQVLGQLFVSTYVRLAAESLGRHELMFRIRPKTHMYLHATECKGYRNVSYYSTWMDEDWLKKISKTMKLTSSKTAQHRVLERWILAIPFNLKKVENLDG